MAPLHRADMLLREGNLGLPFDLDVRSGLECQCGGLLGIVVCACSAEAQRGLKILSMLLILDRVGKQVHEGLVWMFGHSYTISM